MVGLSCSVTGQQAMPPRVSDPLAEVLQLLRYPDFRAVERRFGGTVKGRTFVPVTGMQAASVTAHGFCSKRQLIITLLTSFVIKLLPK